MSTNKNIAQPVMVSTMLALAQMAVALGAFASMGDASPNVQCGASSSYCPVGMPCCSSTYSPSKFGCQVDIGDLSNISAGCGDALPPGRTLCCKMGPGEPPSTTLKNVLVIGDSVSIGYVGTVASQLADVAKVQHGPYDTSDGGAGDVANGVACLDRWLVTQSQQSVKWDLITFNFGLHDLTNTTHCEDLYRSQLTNVTSRLASLNTKLLYVTTTPFMPLRTIGNTVVEDMNKIATDVVGRHSIPVVDMYSVVTSTCGAVYVNCSICRVEPCSYHYNAAGMTMEGKYLADAIRKAL